MFVPLDTKTVYSFMDSVIGIESYVARAKAMGYQSLGMMDIDNLYGAYHFMEVCYQLGIRPIVGVEMVLEHEQAPLKVYLVAHNTQAYQALMKLSTQKMMGESKVENLRPYLEQVTLILPYQEGINQVSLDLPYYIGVFPETPQQSFDHPILPIQTVRYFDLEERRLIQMLHAIRDNQSLQETPPILTKEVLQTPSEMAQLFKDDFPEALDNLEALTSTITYQLEQSLVLPRFNRERPAVEELRERAFEGLSEKNHLSAIYRDRLEKELDIIHQMGFDDYFLIVWDLLRFGRSQGYYMGMGRGSAVGSLVAYALDITGIDPVDKNLLFERFLNLERFSMPDIDIDMPDVYRPEFIRYVREKYGSRHAAQIVTFSTFGAKQAIRDVFKRFGLAEYELTNLTKKIGFRDTLQSAYERNASLRQLILSKPEYQKAFEMAKAIEGQPRQTSIHAAGVVMSDHDLTDRIPLKQGEEMHLTQYDAHGVEANGLLKMDFLGLRNLTFVQRMAERVADKHNVTIDIAKINLEDPDTLTLFAKGQTKGIFQFEATGAISLLKRVKPNCFEDIVATTSLNRPGASDYIDNFIKRRRGKERIDLLDPSIADILEPTYGIMLYQEQVMQIAQRYAGFSLGKADILRRAMGKKKPEEMAAMASEFMTGALKNGHSEHHAKQLFAMMEKFAGYGFNRSHAYAYAALAFQLAYFKAHYPDVFFDVMLNYSNNGYIEDALTFDFQVAQLHINTVPYYDKFDKGKIYLGLKNIKGLPKDFSHWIIDHRPFASIEDFVHRLPEPYAKPALIEPLIKIGLFDQFERNRQKVLVNYQGLREHHKLGQANLFEDNPDMAYGWTDVADFSEIEKFHQEQEVMGIGLSPHPLVKLAKQAVYPITPIRDLVAEEQGQIMVEVLDIRQIRTKKGQPMAFVKVTDALNQMEVTVFPEVYVTIGRTLEIGQFYYLSGKIQDRDGQLQMLLEKALAVPTEQFWVQVANHDDDELVAELLKQHPGPVPVVLRYKESNETIQPKYIGVKKTESLVDAFKNKNMKTIFY
ncbi:DNA polymerase III subunit alpha [Streptococcus moroccensis]|uniref:DNA polymerase III subunit alpha n=1 Tax=Streptococcus moroccensis TaxID=1451356 RepID=A0ABT9YP05_9STRE|nr:DNA polymerase III subunit alpha [Streptococcus moroccensis]MDQ0221724.1 DNA polymerase-3 subunit alpha [Streptococcus moroccensis]